MHLYGKCVFILLFTMSMATTCDITTCALDLAKDFGDVSTLCKKVPGIITCFSNGSKSCTDVEKKAFQHLIDSLNEAEKKCNDGQGLKSNIGGLLVVVTLVVARHFL